MDGIGERIRAKRKAVGLTQEEVARRTNLTLKAFGDLERGDVRDPHVSSLTSVARALGVGVVDLLEGPTPPAEPSDTGLSAYPAEELRAEALRLSETLKLNRTLESAKAETREEMVSRPQRFAAIAALDEELLRRGEGSLDTLIPAYRRWKRIMTTPTEVAEIDATEAGGVMGPASRWTAEDGE